MYVSESITSFWLHFVLILCFIITSLGCFIYGNLTIHEFGGDAYFVNIVILIPYIIVFGLFVLWALWRHGGFVSEVQQSHVMHRVFAVVGFTNGISRIMQTVSVSVTAMTLQASMSHLIIPFVVAFVLTADPSCYKLFSFKALAGAVGILLAVLGHISVAYLGDPLPFQNVDMIFRHALFFLSLIPLAISSLTQQHLLYIRRVNPLHFLFTRKVFSYIRSQLSLITGIIEEGGWSHLFSSVTNFTLCLTSKSSSTLTPLKNCSDPPFSRFLLGMYTFCSITSQLCQVYIVRKFDYVFIALLMLVIPTLAFLIPFSLKWSLTSYLLQPFLGQQGTHRLYSWQTPLIETSPVLIFVLYAVIITGAALFRLDDENNLKQDFMLPGDPSLSYAERNIFQLFTPFLQTSCGLPETVDELYERYCIKLGLSLPQLEHYKASESFKRFKSENGTTTNQNGLINSPRGIDLLTVGPSLPFYLPSPMPAFRTVAPIIRPTLMNPWSGYTLCEYTDYKRLYDTVFIYKKPINQTEVYCNEFTYSIDDDDIGYNEFEPDGLLRPVRGTLASQYTRDSLQLLANTEDALKRLYVYCSLGTLATSMIAAQAAAAATEPHNVDHQLQSSVASCSSSSHTQLIPGGVAEEGSEISFA